MKTDTKILITGVTSIHGWPIYEYFKSILKPENLFAIRPPKMKIPSGKRVRSGCITDTKFLKEIREEFNPTVVIHAAGVCDLDVCEDRPEWAHRLNVGGAENIFELFNESANIMYISSDLVFSGNNPPVGGYSEAHKPDPVSVVGSTFRLAEKVILQSSKNSVVRIGLPLGASITKTKGAVDWIEGRLRKNRPVTLFYDEIRSCVECDKIGAVVSELISKQASGVYHYGVGSVKSIYDIGDEIVEAGGYSRDLLERASRLDDLDGPPRVGDIRMSSIRL